MLAIFERRDILNYCLHYNIKLEDFNEPVFLLMSCNCESLFEGCSSFNQPVIIPEGTISCKRMFFGCKSFNQSIEIPSSVKICSEMFAWCSVFNSPVIINEGVVNCFNMFNYCRKFNNSVIIPKSVENVALMMNECISFRSTVSYFKEFLSKFYRESEIDWDLFGFEWSGQASVCAV